MSKLHWQGNPIYPLVLYIDDVGSRDDFKRFNATIEVGEQISRNNRTRKCIVAMLCEEKGFKVDNLDNIMLLNFYRIPAKPKSKIWYSITWDLLL